VLLNVINCDIFYVWTCWEALRIVLGDLLICWVLRSTSLSRRTTLVSWTSSSPNFYWSRRSSIQATCSKRLFHSLNFGGMLNEVWRNLMKLLGIMYIWKIFSEGSGTQANSSRHYRIRNAVLILNIEHSAGAWSASSVCSPFLNWRWRNDMLYFLFRHFMNFAMLEFIDLLRIVVLRNVFPVFRNTLAVLTLSFS